MATDITLYIGEHPYAGKFKISDAAVWQNVRSQIEAAMKAGRGLITVPDAKGRNVVFVYNESLRVSWVENAS